LRMGMNFSTSKVSLSVTMSLMRRSSRFAPFFTSGSASVREGGREGGREGRIAFCYFEEHRAP